MIAPVLDLFKATKIHFKIVNETSDSFLIEFDVKAKPAARVEKISVGESGELIIQTRAKPVDGEANQTIIEIISDLIGIPKSHVEIIRGDKSKNKRIKLLVEITANKNVDYFKKKINELLDQQA